MDPTSFHSNAIVLPPKSYKKLIATKITPRFRESAGIIEVDLEDPSPRQIVIRNHYSGVNASDVNLTAGRYVAAPSLPMDLGFEAVGTVEAVGSEVLHLKAGDAVVTTNIGGGYREYNTVKASRALPVPEATPEVLSIVVSGLTASIALEVVGEMKSDETVLVTAAAGGTGQYAVQLAKRAGNHVIGTCGTPEKAELLRSLGCDRVINYREENVRQVLRAEYPAGIDLIYESVGGTLFETCLNALAIRGRLLCIGFISEYMGDIERVTGPRLYRKLLPKSASVRGFFLPHYPEHMRTHTQGLLRLQQSGALKIAIDPRPFHGIESVVDAVEYLHSGQSRGKVVVEL